MGRMRGEVAVGNKSARTSDVGEHWVVMREVVAARCEIETVI